MEYRDLVVIGAGASGLSAALSAKNDGIDDILIVEKDDMLGGILNQCIHQGFGVHYLGENLTGPEYAQILSQKVYQNDIDVMLNTFCIDISEDKIVTLTNEDGVHKIKAKSVILSVGARERHIKELKIPGSRPSGVYTGGLAQQILNKRGYKIGKESVIIGSGDIGLIMCRRLILNNIKVKAIIEINDKIGGNKRNFKECVEDFDVPVIKNSTICEIKGTERIEAVVVKNIKNDAKQTIKCDTLITSIGLTPNLTVPINSNMKIDSKKINMDKYNQCSIEGVFCCGNICKIYSLVDDVSYDGEYVGKIASEYIKSKNLVDIDKVEVDKSSVATDGITCLICPNGCNLKQSATGDIEGNLCEKGIEFFKDEIINKKRSITSTVKIKNSKDRLPIKTSKPLEFKYIYEAVNIIDNMEVSSPVKMGDIIIENILNTGVNIVSCRDI